MMQPQQQIQQQQQQQPGAPRLTKEDVKHFQTIFPAYMDSRLTPSEGRRLTLAQSVESPTLEEISIALRALGYRTVAVDHGRSLPALQGTAKYPVVPRGCIKVQIKQPESVHHIRISEYDTQTRAPTVAGLDSKHQVLVRVAALIKAKGGERPKVPELAEVIAATTPNQPKVNKK